MTFNRDQVYQGWACTDCTMLLANGETPPDLDETETTLYLERVARGCAGCEVTLGMFREDHACASDFTVTWLMRHESVRGSLRRGWVEVRADDYGDAMDQAHWAIPAGAWLTVARAHDLETETDRGGECDCECQTFSWSACDVCGSNLGGHRDAVVFWIQPSPEPAGISGPGLHTDPQETCPACAADPRISPADHAGIMVMAASLAAGREQFSG